MNNKFPIYRDAYTLVVAIEQVVHKFGRYHKYTLGSELRHNAYLLLEYITFAINNKTQRLEWINKAHLNSERLKIKIQLAKTLNLYPSFKHFENIATLAVAVSKQCKSWQKKLQHPRQQEGYYEN